MKREFSVTAFLYHPSLRLCPLYLPISCFLLSTFQHSELDCRSPVLRSALPCLSSFEAVFCDWELIIAQNNLSTLNLLHSLPIHPLVHPQLLFHSHFEHRLTLQYEDKQPPPVPLPLLFTSNHLKGHYGYHSPARSIKQTTLGSTYTVYSITRRLPH